MIYFASDMHLGLRDSDTLLRERRLVAWLDRVAADAEAIYLLGDLFDFWYEYRRVVPKGFSRLLGKFSELTDRGIAVHFFVGNHDLWAGSYLHDECGLTMHYGPEDLELYGCRLHVAHGDNLGMEGRPLLRLMNGVFRSSAIRWLFSHLVHPDAALRFGQWWSASSRKSKNISHRFGGEQEPLVRYARTRAAAHATDCFVFGHNHHLGRYDLPEGGAVFFLGEWFARPGYLALAPDGRIRLLALDGSDVCEPWQKSSVRNKAK